ncbi:hypothetical protein ACEPAG_3521 [Sanghuangporus baumii]
MDRDVSLDDVQAAAERIRPYIHRTPVATCSTLDLMASSEMLTVKLFMKCENFQKVGAFKIRGATNAILTLKESRAESMSDLTVVTHSSGNHAQALAYASRVLGVSCHIVMPSNSAAVKKAAVRGYGASVTECMPTLQAREDCTEDVIEELQKTGRSVEFIPPYDDNRIISGQGSLALELLEQSRDMGYELDVLITSVGGGGMLSGCAVATKGIDPRVRVVGAEPAAADDAYRSFNSKTFIPAASSNTVADGLRTSLGQITFRHILKHVDAIHTVSEGEIILAMKLVYERMKLVIEPSSAVTIATSLKKLSQKRGKCSLNIGLVFSGGNVDLLQLSNLFASIREVL